LTGVFKAVLNTVPFDQERAPFKIFVSPLYPVTPGRRLLRSSLSLVREPKHMADLRPPEGNAGFFSAGFCLFPSVKTLRFCGQKRETRSWATSVVAQTTWSDAVAFVSSKVVPPRPSATVESYATLNLRPAPLHGRCSHIDRGLATMEVWCR